MHTKVPKGRRTSVFVSMGVIFAIDVTKPFAFSIWSQ